MMAWAALLSHEESEKDISSTGSPCLGSLGEFLHWVFCLDPTPTCLKDPQSSQYQSQLQYHPQSCQLTIVIILTRWQMELCSLWSKNIHSTWYQQFKGLAAHKGVVAPGFSRVSKTRYVSNDNMANIILCNSSLIGDFLNEYSGLEVLKAGEGNPQTREEESKLSLLSTESNLYLAVIPGMW